MRSIEFRIPISPTPSFYDQIEFFHFCLCRVGGMYKEAKIIVFVGGLESLESVKKANQWSNDFNVEWHIVPPEIFEKYNFYGTANWRFKGPEPDSDLIILVDADTMLVRAFDEHLLCSNLETPTVFGFQAHFPPSEGPDIHPSPTSPQYWEQMLSAVGISKKAIKYRYSMDMEAKLPLAPPYYNYGFVVFNQSSFNRIRNCIFEVYDIVKSITSSFMQCQIALTLALLKENISHKHLPARYNFINDNSFLINYSSEKSEIILIHYLRNKIIDRSKIGQQVKMDTSALNVVDRIVFESVVLWQNQRVR